jgi:hypothetical protein
MFKGRARERNEIVQPTGSHVVYGGRRLGKTALLRHILDTQPANAIFAYVDINVVHDAADAFEQMSGKIGKTVFNSPVRTAANFTSAIIAWLEADGRRRLLLLIDEADNFVRKEAESDFSCIQAMLKLMAETNNRFKFVLAGLHNVSRIVRSENSPLVQISSNPVRIGPLVGRDVDDAEFLVRGPLAAMGYEFESREDVWRILSFSNYYPVLIQVFCQELVNLIHDHVVQTGKLPKTISTKLIDKALTSSDVRANVFASFEKTITSIEGRYELITYILAVREMIERQSGMAAEGLTPAEVAERAMECWPAAFPKGSDPVEFEYLLEEMEGFGIARRTSAVRFALRSRSLLELMAKDENELQLKLARFKNERKPDPPFDPKNYRRKMGKPLPRVASEGRFSPLTDGQEADLLAAENRVGVVFGAPIAGIAYVEAALADSRRAQDKLVEADARTFVSKKGLLDHLKRSSRGSCPKVLIVSSATAWHPDWVLEAARSEKVRSDVLRVVFVGDSRHARIWSGDCTVRRRPLPQIKIVRLRPWARSFIGSQIEMMQLGHDLVDEILSDTGGWNEITGPLIIRMAEKPETAALLIAAAGQKALESPKILHDLGIPEDLAPFFRELALYADGSTITTADFGALCTWEGRAIDPKIVGSYGDLMGILSFPPDEGSEYGHRKVDLNPFTLKALLRGA